MGNKANKSGKSIQSIATSNKRENVMTANTNTALDLTNVETVSSNPVPATLYLLPLLSPVQSAKLQLAAAREQVKRDRFIKNLKKDWVKQAAQIEKARKAAEKESEVQTTAATTSSKVTRYVVFGQVWKRNFQTIPVETLVAIVDASYVIQGGTLNPAECRQTVQRCLSLLQELGQVTVSDNIATRS